VPCGVPSVRAIVDAGAAPAVQTASTTSCTGVGGVPYRYQIAETELTVAQWSSSSTRSSTLSTPTVAMSTTCGTLRRVRECGPSTARSTATSARHEASATTWRRESGRTRLTGGMDHRGHRICLGARRYRNAHPASLEVLPAAGLTLAR
jgi:hypothetical protein